MGTALAHMLRADAHPAADTPDDQTGEPAAARSPSWSAEDQAGPAQDQAVDRAVLAGARPPPGTRTVLERDRGAPRTKSAPLTQTGQPRPAPRRARAAGQPA